MHRHPNKQAVIFWHYHYNVNPQ